jgi:hypothetical protein
LKSRFGHTRLRLRLRCRGRPYELNSAICLSFLLVTWPHEYRTKSPNADYDKLDSLKPRRRQLRLGGLFLEQFLKCRLCRLRPLPAYIGLKRPTLRIEVGMPGD